MGFNKKGKHAVQPANPGAAPKKEKKLINMRKLACFAGIGFAVLCGVCLVVYLGGVVLFTQRFMPQTSLSGTDVSLKSASDVAPLVDKSISNHIVHVQGYGFALNLDADQIGLTVDSQQASDRLLHEMNAWLWPYECLREKDITTAIAVSVKDAGLSRVVDEAVRIHNENAQQPTDATVAFDAASNAFVVTPEQFGTALNSAAVAEQVAHSVASLCSDVVLTENELLKPRIFSSDTSLKAKAQSANNLLGADLELLRDGTSVAEVNPALVSNWVTFAEDGTCAISDELLAAWVEELAGQVSTCGADRTYTRPDGKVITVSGGAFGWNLDKEATLGLVREAVTAKTVGQTELPFYERGQIAPAEGNRDWGLRYCDIDLSEQYVRFYDETGALVWEAPCVSGAPDGNRDTPTGTYYITSKASPCKLKGTNPDGSKYESTVSYWMPFVANTIGLHDADWQASFGGTRYMNGAGSHGCVNLPPGAASVLFGIIQNGDVVVCHW